MLRQAEKLCLRCTKRIHAKEAGPWSHTSNWDPEIWTWGQPTSHRIRQSPCSKQNTELHNQQPSCRFRASSLPAAPGMILSGYRSVRNRLLMRVDLPSPDSPSSEKQHVSQPHPQAGDCCMPTEACDGLAGMGLGLACDAVHEVPRSPLQMWKWMAETTNSSKVPGTRKSGLRSDHHLQGTLQSCLPFPINRMPCRSSHSRNPAHIGQHYSCSLSCRRERAKPAILWTHGLHLKAPLTLHTLWENAMPGHIPVT